ncbi:MAG: hypothetical protein F6K06_25530 [Okeania sp. SIO1H4]|uniref:Uncharacterized protein n=2 Tax=Microcoleaceae TaxID=1892252 RepID=A0A3N6PGK7_9CYAN|nr:MULTISPECIES: hypothetical protein [unclassified Okeania]NEP05933.1 hypothetical protein [Okeania sp. SIO4D6]NES78918.1 hypothetical protein [Okeania sp. SIO1H4]NET96190.1 hypothetical protein [Okeania sp. SIO1H2]RQH26100.1 hypothetical protein D4Z78_00780 [Okeania hirsuta]NEP72863.1 hypothetical protein [Okeania sp. SIO2G5]
MLSLEIKDTLSSIKNMKNLAQINQESIWKKHIVKTKRKGYFRNIQEVKVVAKVANMGLEPSRSKSFTSKVWVVSSSL